jgi:SAM-dependent methyltransferase
MRSMESEALSGETSKIPRELPPVCPVCENSGTNLFLALERERYYACSHCEAVFMDPQNLPDQETELARYRLHNNSLEDERYACFLRRLGNPVLASLSKKSKGLDFGCGPAPLLSRLLEKEGHAMKNYDPFFFPQREVLEETYDFIVCSEAAEHFHHPWKTFLFLDGLLRPGGFLGIMTSFLEDRIDFATWHYRRDETHVVFYREKTFRVLASRLGWTPSFPGPNLAFLHKPSGGSGFSSGR